MGLAEGFILFTLSRILERGLYCQSGAVCIRFLYGIKDGLL